MASGIRVSTHFNKCVCVYSFACSYGCVLSRVCSQCLSLLKPVLSCVCWNMCALMCVCALRCVLSCECCHVCLEFKVRKFVVVFTAVGGCLIYSTWFGSLAGILQIFNPNMAVLHIQILFGMCGAWWSVNARFKRCGPTKSCESKRKQGTPYSCRHFGQVPMDKLETIATHVLKHLGTPHLAPGSTDLGSRSRFRRINPCTIFP